MRVLVAVLISSLRTTAAVAACAALLISAARAQSVTINDISASTTSCVSGTACGSVGTSAQLVVPATRSGFPRQQLTLANASAAGGSDISCGFSSSISLHGIGTFLIGAGAQPVFWPRGTAPTAAIYCIAAGSATPMLVLLGN
jgi:hypothetical protein